MENSLPSGFSEETVRASSDGLDIKVVTALPEIPPKGIVQILHGMCEHKERYFGFMQFLRENGYVCAIHDHRGHGETIMSREDLGYFYDGGWRAIVEDARIVSGHVSKKFPGLPLTLMGHSMGSLVARSYTKRYDSSIDALIVCGSPSLNPACGIGKIYADIICMVKGGHFRPQSMHGLSFGTFNKGFAHEGSDNSWICSDPEVVNRYDSDPLCNFTFTANGFSNLLALMMDSYSITGWKKGNLFMPVLFISGNEDPCLINVRRYLSAVGCMKRNGYKNVNYRLYDGMRHEILNEKEKALVWDDVLEFISGVLPRRNS